jgi:hypothetical protein
MTSRMHLTCKSGSVGTRGGQPPRVTRPHQTPKQRLTPIRHLRKMFIHEILQIISELFTNGKRFGAVPEDVGQEILCTER